MFYFIENLVGLNFSRQTACTHCASLQGSVSGKLENKSDQVENNHLKTIKFTITNFTFVLTPAHCGDPGHKGVWCVSGANLSCAHRHTPHQTSIYLWNFFV